MRIRPCVAGLVFGAALAMTPGSARAYRPFDGTDAAVADEGEFELELGPAQIYWQGGRRYLIAPATVLNLGFWRNLELVTDQRTFVGVDPAPGEPRVRVLDTDVLVKWLIRRGRLQGDSGLSIALEAGPWTPEIGGDSGFGVQANFIFSYRFGSGTLHFNEQGALARDERFEAFSSVIVEGPPDFVVRPVAELFVDREFGDVSTYSALVGAIWTARESLTVDLGVRAARVGTENAGEIRFGLTWGIPLWTPAAQARSGDTTKSQGSVVRAE